MAYGDVGGAVVQLVITCMTPRYGIVSIEKGDALRLTGDYEVNNCSGREDYAKARLFGEALAASTSNGEAIPVKVRGISIFTYSGDKPVRDGKRGVICSSIDGVVQLPLASKKGNGLVLKVDEAAKQVHVLL